MSVPRRDPQLVDRAVALTGPVPDVLDTRAVVRMAQEHGEEALHDLEDAVAESDIPATATLVHLAEARLLARDPKAARDTLRAITSARPGPAALHPLDALAFERVREELNSSKDQ